MVASALDNARAMVAMARRVVGNLMDLAGFIWTEDVNMG
jgi:hypothetical protein